ncbi:SusC/RagA family TonB-linked outer membrane protein [Moheibacter sediminis]|uniref:TonB-linked outer membrane protein, SusC/RagA family n=1 Tax=Moheibacter sediminis TaxID=1434700 RepID=A0A1W1Y9C1_9FLAO|nr:SusC/RagA family TonB-linked outer membrane protein [Moheibacter sediminis]SMC32338.1 TonB-linked outer membrane protein, SusC/RagA family [Moheibacter sediminis]
MRRNVLLSFLFLFAVFQFVDAQVRGTVNDQDGFAVADAEVTVRGTDATAVTDENGAFEIDAKVGDVLVVTDMLGATKDFSVASANMGTLSFGVEVLTEAVILGYGISESDEQKTGAYTTVKAEDIEKVGSVSFDQALQGQVAGVSIGASSGQPGANAPIFVRGITSLTGNTMPLVVVNGVPITTDDMSGIAAASNPLANIDPSTIESVTVLKDAVGTSLYGSRGANGVILVTLKKGARNSGKFMFNTEFGIGDVAFEKNDWLDAQGHVNYFATALGNAYGMTYDDTVAELGWDGVTNNNWRDAVRQNAVGSQKYVFNYSGGSENMRLFTSLSYNSQDGIARDSRFDRVSGYLGADWTVNDKLGINFDVSLSKAQQTGPTDGSSFSNPIFAGNLMSPTQAIYNTDGSYNLDLYFLNPEFNPLALQDKNKTLSDFYKALINIGGNYDITKDLNFETKFGVDYNFYDELLYWNPDFGDGNTGHPLGNGYGYASQRNFNTWNWSNALKYDKTFADVHNLTLTAGTEAIKYTYSYVMAERRGYPAGNTKPTLDNAANPSDASSGGADYSFVSYFGRMAYNFDGRYSVTGNIRRDGSSRFGANNKWGTFWGVGAAWNINREAFLSGSTVNELKLRGSYGTVGNGEIGNYASMNLYRAANGAYMGAPAGAITQLGNPELKWETTSQLNVGIDFGIFQNRLRATVDYYIKDVEDLLYTVPTNASSSGFTSYWTNDGEMRSRGIEATLTVVPVRTEDFEWSITGNYAYNDSEITNINGGNIAIRNGFKAWENGHNPTEFYTRLWAGVNQEDGTPLWYTDATRTETTGDVSQAAQAFTGKQALPVHTAGLSTSFNYKGFVLNSQFTYAGGHSVYDRWGFVYNSDGLYGQLNTREDWAEGAWTPENAGSATLPQVVYGGNNASSTASSRYLYDADHIRWRSAEIGYRFGKKILGEKLFLDNVYVYVRGYNLVVWTFDKDLWFDPEVGSNDADLVYGIERMGLYDMTQPNLRQFVFGVRLDF